MIIREATEIDIEPIAEVHLASWKDTYKNIVSEEIYLSRTYERQVNRWQERFKRAKEFILVCESKDNKLVGFASFEIDNKDYIGILNTIYIDPFYKGKGIGRELVKGIVRRLVDLNINRMKVSVLDKNDSKHFYEHLGAIKEKEETKNIWGEALKELTYLWEGFRMI